jgi:uncharacterized integral membrane protein
VAKRKKHHKKNNKHKANVAKSTTPQAITPAQKTQNKSEDQLNVQVSLEIKDVKFSLLVFVVIVLIFAILFFILQNQSVSEYFYGFIKIN